MTQIKTRVLFLSILSLFLSRPAFAQVSANPDVVTDVYACKNIVEPLERLSCYDDAVGRLEAAQESGDIVAISKSQVEEVKKDSFGFNIPSLPKLGNLFGGSSSDKQTVTMDDGTKVTVEKERPKVEGFDEVELTIGKTSSFGYNKTRFFFTNGQVWEQTESMKIKIPKAKGDQRNTAQIKKAALGSFLLKVNGKGRSIRVKRVR